MSRALLVGLSAEVVAAYVAHNAVPAAEVPRIITSVHAQMSALAAGRPSRATPAQASATVAPGGGGRDGPFRR